jgi:hypothetical protein
MAIDPSSRKEASSKKEASSEGAFPEEGLPEWKEESPIREWP